MGCRVKNDRMRPRATLGEGTLEVGNGGGNYFTSAGTASLNAWHHMAVTRSGSTFNLFTDCLITLFDFLISVYAFAELFINKILHNSINNKFFIMFYNVKESNALLFSCDFLSANHAYLNTYIIFVNISLYTIVKIVFFICDNFFINQI
jgi:hypothetical protein